MRSLATLILFFGGLAPALASVDSWDFRVLLDDREIGHHRFTLKRVGAQHELQSIAQFDLRLLFVSAWRYSHQAVERWDGDCLSSIESRTDTNGKQSAVSGESRDGRIAVQRGNGREVHDGCIMSFAYWNPRILGADRLLNSQTGELVPVAITSLGREPVEVRGSPVLAERHRIRGPGIEIDVWYADGDWVALTALAGGGRTLRYELAGEAKTS